MEKDVNPIKLKYKYAADYGFILGGYIAIFFLIDFLFSGNTVASTLSTIGVFGTPILCYQLAKRYRDRGCGGYIRFGQVWSFGLFLFFFASLIMSVFYYVRFQFLEPDYIAMAFSQSLQMLEQMHYPQESLDAMVNFGVPTTIEVVITYLWFYLFGGAILFLFISPLIARKNPDETNPGTHSDKDEDKPYEPYQDKNQQ